MQHFINYRLAFYDGGQLAIHKKKKIIKTKQQIFFFCKLCQQQSIKGVKYEFLQIFFLPHFSKLNQHFPLELTCLTSCY